MMQRSLSLSLSDLSSDVGIGSRSVSSLSLTSDDGVDETDTQRVSRDRMERELMIAYSRRRPLIRPLDLAPDTRKHCTRVSVWLTGRVMSSHGICGTLNNNNNNNADNF